MKILMVLSFIVFGSLSAFIAHAQDDYDPHRDQQTSTETSTSTDTSSTASTETPKTDTQTSTPAK